MKKNVLVLTTTYPRWKNDNQPAFVHELCSHLTEHHSVIVLAPHYPGAAKKEKLDGVTIHRFSYMWPASWQKLCYNGGIVPNLQKNPLLFFLVPFLFLSQLFSSLSLIRTYKIECVHAHWVIPQGYIAHLIKKWRNIPFILTIHGSDIVSAQKGMMKWFAKKALSSADSVTVNSEHTHSLVTAVHKRDVENIPMGISTEHYSERASVPTSLKDRKGKVILFVGRLSKQKGVSVLIDAFADIQKKYQDSTLVIVGEGPERLSLDVQARKNGTADHVLFAGMVPQKDLPGYFQHADVTVLPSVGFEGLGLVLAESLSAETPVVGTRVGGIPEIIDDKKTGLLVPENNSHELSQAILSLLDDSSLANRLAQTGKKKVTTQFSWQRVSQQFEELYSQL